MKPVVVIPAYKPASELSSVIDGVTSAGFKVILVNDGSPAEYDPVFARQKSNPDVTLLQHAVNMGKGQALKTAFNYFLNHLSHSSPGVITADADGQHLVTDIIRIANGFCVNPDSLILGARQFEVDIPLRSKFGNILTRFIFRIIAGIKLDDTQTGLRGMPAGLLPEIIGISSNHYDFELDVLLLAVRKKIQINEERITTVYYDQNNSSHFNPVFDSLKIYFVFFRFLAFSIICGVLDWVSFSAVYFFTGNVFLSETIARVLFGAINFRYNRDMVFKSTGNYVLSAIKYTILVAVNLCLSFALIKLLATLGATVYLGKLIALLTMFIFNFSIQRLFVF